MKLEKKKIKILCLPELSISGYGCQDLFLNNWVINKSFKILKKVLPLCNDILVAVGLPLMYKSKLFNTCCVIKDCEIVGFAVKTNLPNDGVHYESRWFESWPLGKVDEISIENKIYPIGTLLIDFENIKIGFEICRDSWDNERPAKYYDKKKHLLILNPIASHYAFGKFDFWKNLVIDSSKKYNCTYLLCNLLGNEAGKIIFDGSIILANKGKLVGLNNRFSFHNYSLSSFDVNISKLSEPPVNNSFNQYEEFSYAMSLALFDYKRKSGCDGFVLSISGGADSASIAIMIAEMVKKSINELGITEFVKKFKLNLKKEKINELKKMNKDYVYKEIVNEIFTTTYQRSSNSSKKTFESAKSISNFVGAKFYHWNVDDEINSYTKKIEGAIKRNLSWKNDNITKQNIQARTRSPIVWMLANLNNSLLLSTSNRSEIGVGYSTMDGDSSGSISPIAGLDKLFIINFLKYSYKTLNYKCLEKVMNLSPSAELLPSNLNQSDEDDLMPYEILIKIERLAIKMKKSPLEIYKELSNSINVNDMKIKEYIKRYFSLFGKNQWKRERFAPSFHFDDFSLDPNSWYRFPILSSNFKEELDEL